MIEDEVLNILRGSSDDGMRIAELADQFRMGRDIGDLLRLLNSDDPEVIDLGAWMVGEIVFERSSAGSIILRLVELLRHELPSIRWRAINALWPMLGNDDPAASEILRLLTQDPNPGVRSRARLALKGIDNSCS